MSSNDRVIIFDTTLRDGEQSPGASMTGEEKLRIAKALERLRVDVIEAGFAIPAPVTLPRSRRLPTTSRTAPCAACRAPWMRTSTAPPKRSRVPAAGGSTPLSPPARFICNTSCACNRIRSSSRPCMRSSARNLCSDVEFSCEDAGRSEIDFLCRIIEAAIDAGARTINIPDTVGYAIPHQYAETIRQLLNRVPNADKAVFSVHCHNDLGLAVANSLAAVVAGARQVECTINGLGERAGNAALEEIVIAIKTREDLLGVHTRIDTPHILSTSRMVSGITGFPVQPNKAIVGANAFAHESGIHQDGVLKHRETYEIMSAQSVGWNTNKMVMGKHSGRAAFRSRLDELGIVLAGEAELNAAFARFKALADKKHEIFDEDLQALVSDTLAEEAPEHFKLITLDVASKTGEVPQAQVVVSVAGAEHSGNAQGSGPVDATFKAIESIASSEANLQLYSVNAITQGTDSQGEVTVRLEKGGRIVNGNGADTDILVASAKAYINALNLMQAGLKAHPQAADV
ncbi:2-isopropylmalate synthase [Pseudomonas anguilliseptica]|uniref:2-isopropylmalate synthase n=1 Tax=Pseudomonas anguilliseptica TaxID=53406 RepID=UPI00325C2B64